MRFDFISIFPQYFNALELSLMGKAVQNGQLSINVHDLRDWTEDKHRTVDDAPYGGGAGMVMRADIWGKALDSVIAGSGRRVLAVPTPSGIPLTQAAARELVSADQIIFACGRYEGIDYRVVEHYRNAGEIEVFEYSIGDYVLNGGEVAALVLVEAVARLLDGFMSNPESLVEESFENNLLEYPAFTRPLQWRELEVPEVLRTGDHGRIEAWRRDLSLMRTATRRPDMVRELDPHQLSLSDLQKLAYYGWVWAGSDQPVLPGETPDFAWTELAVESSAVDLQMVAKDGRVVAEGVWVEAAENPQLVPKRMLESHPLVVKLWVDSKFMGRGLEGALLMHLLEASALKERSLVIAVDAADKELTKLVKSLGFKKQGRKFIEGSAGKENRAEVFFQR
ncbi:tRNA (guanine-N(1)-)-methyltransferase [Gleimia coleocanis DSM 15436]|uniref:tRNA (guanine-N(1)-)-methyltransferase n=1 Tax=Gleimia coleocanis DSM 15436 TaxID=525245 RepID=C0W181_9ACTO|nr:tRNA (guanosine(37)-N1)-methyltransferase TrmD [Gleimia coleocanis]EEH63570.1 tRNA (guanine-N(1)-)-methyltransferase [Gleimia coleocanis DSM 15436]